MTAKIIPFDQKQQALWAEYLEAKERADRTGDMQDGIAAGRAWARWIDLFTRRGVA